MPERYREEGGVSQMRCSAEVKRRMRRRTAG